MVQYQRLPDNQGQEMDNMNSKDDSESKPPAYGLREVELGKGTKAERKYFAKLRPSWPRSSNTVQPYRGWKPLSLSPPMLGAMAAASLLIAGGIETLAQQSLKKGGLALSPSLDEVPSYAMFAYLYVPNIAAAAYSLVWNWIDLDVKRMQPWFELSKPEGATAENSLLLEYPAEFVAFVPLRAAKRKYG